MYQYWFINFNRCTTLTLLDVINRNGVCVRQGTRVYGNTLLSAQYFCKLKTALKNKVYYSKQKKTNKQKITFRKWAAKI